MTLKTDPDTAAGLNSQQGTVFGTRLRQLRIQHGMTLAVLARQLGVTAAYLSQLETGKRGKASAVLVDQICGCLGLIWDEAEALKTLAGLSDTRVVVDSAALGPQATRAANLFAMLLPRLDDEDARKMADWLENRSRQE